jgi:response regulator NasT
MKTILVVDDEPMIRRQVIDVLKNYGFGTFLEAGTGTEAVRLAETREPLLIVMDVSMPEMDGITAAEKIGRKSPVPVVLLTANADLETIERARNAGVMNYLVKPFRDEQLALHRFIEVAALKDQVAELKATLESRKQIEKAKGALMRQGLSEGEAYRKMQKLAMDKRKSLKEVADAILLMEG